MTTRIRNTLTIGVLVGLCLGILLTPRPSAAQCVGASLVENFASNMKGCAGTVGFGARASMCAAGWRVCSAAEWVARFAGQTPTYNYWTNDNLRGAHGDVGCFASFSLGDVCDTPMRVCTAPTGHRDGLFGTASRFYAIQTLLRDGGITLVTSIDKATFAAKTFAGHLSANEFGGAQIGGGGSLTLDFTGGDSGTDGTSPFVKLVDQTALPQSDFTPVTDFLGNKCEFHGCGFEAENPNLYFGGCASATAGVLCCR